MRSQRPFDHDQVILVSKWMFVPNMKKFPQGVPEILHSQKMVGHLEKAIPPATADAGMET